VSLIPAFDDDRVLPPEAIKEPLKPVYLEYIHEYIRFIE